MTKVSINLPATTTIKHYGSGDDLQTIRVDWAKLPETVVAQIAEVGAKTILTNVWNGGGKEATETERAAAVNKKLDAWMRGEFNVNNRGEAITTVMREAFQGMLEAATGASLTAKAFWEAQADMVQAATNKRPETGKVIPLDLVIESYAKSAAKRKGGEWTAVRDDLTARLEAKAQGILAERAKALATIDVSGIDL